MISDVSNKVLSYSIVAALLPETATKRSANSVTIRQKATAAAITKTVNADGIELTTELKIKDDKMAFVNQMNKITGVKNATLVSYNGVYMS